MIVYYINMTKQYKFHEMEILTFECFARVVGVELNTKSRW